ncbi:hypothetical protein CEXT_17411 [Caerostris extrusa]|uniref:Uncharacterized protein n=1 Tax=Caerostris extrusa TaxID=172846 RepID=A0AAV4U2K2_CAEEX|nr:hypothetical protein CEXT_17411 [Caerostris extrusa]
MSIYVDVDAFNAGLEAIVLTRLQRPCLPPPPRSLFKTDAIISASRFDSVTRFYWMQRGIMTPFVRHLQDRGRDLPLNKVLRLPFFGFKCIQCLIERKDLPYVLLSGQISKCTYYKVIR